jgi:alkanesulfonate monooxygenase SsuD/methylene tetrahydromethanopterin reductase-like flavin-dependent oxidoreductase (luciferase family)
MADLGIHGMPTFGSGPRSLDEYGRVLEMLPPEFSTVWISDHLQLGEGGFNEAWTTATYLAAAFPRYRVGHLVLSQSYRNPALLAKMAATLQHLSAGRYVMGIGAGWLEEEYRAYDFEYPRPGIRVAQLGEAIEVLKAMWTQWPATFVGEHYRVEGAYCDPQPATPIPILVGTNGPRALRVAARLADMWCWDGPWAASYRQPYETLRSHCEEIGRPFDSIAKVSELSVELPVDASTFEPTVTHPFYPGQVFRISGPRASDVVRDVTELIEHGVSHIAVNLDSMETLRAFVDEVVPRLDGVGIAVTQVARA